MNIHIYVRTYTYFYMSLCCNYKYVAPSNYLLVPIYIIVYDISVLLTHN